MEPLHTTGTADSRDIPSQRVEPILDRLRLLYLRHPRTVELAVYTAAGTGLLLIEGLALSWSWLGPVLLAHVIGGTLLMLLVVLPYVAFHRARLTRVRRPWVARAGQAIEVALWALVLSGLFLFFVGNPGALAGRIAHEAHLWLSFPLLLLLPAHLLWRSLLATPFERHLRMRPPRRD